MDINTWISIKGYEGLYEVSSNGIIKSLSKSDKTKKGFTSIKKEKILKQNPCGVGYLSVNLSKNSKQKSFYVHRLVAIHFITNKLNKRTVNHKDLNKKNNNYLNLEWMTQGQNIRHSWANGACTPHGVSGERNHNSKLKESEILEIKESLKSDKWGISVMLSKKYNVSTTTIHGIKTNRIWRNIKAN